MHVTQSPLCRTVRPFVGHAVFSSLMGGFCILLLVISLSDLARFEADLKEKAMNARGGSSSTEAETSNKKDKRKLTAAESKKQKVR